MTNKGDTIKAAVVGGSGYTGGELLRILVGHPKIEVAFVTSRKYQKRSVSKVHPNLRDQTDLKFTHPQDLSDKCAQIDLLFSSLPHGKSMELIDGFLEIADRIVDLSADFRLQDEEDYLKWYGREHAKPNLIRKFVYGLPELHRADLKKAKYVASPGCTATSAIIPLKPIVAKFGVQIDKVVVDSKVGSSAGGATINPGSHHPERRDVIRSYKPSGHRHTAEMEQELGIPVSFSPHAVELVRGIMSTIHVFLDSEYEEKDIWQSYLKYYQDEPFIRFVKERRGIYRYPEPKLLIGTNLFEIGFEKDQRTNRLVVMAALDNLVKGAAGQAVQAANLMLGFDETLGLERIGLHPI